ncbi:MAG: FHA domain-containing protein [Myxococcales bacterium]|nr:FHA domain-containing protein [Myxococcales bacterium]
MTNDRTKKTVRSFKARDYLFEIFEQMSDDLDCSVDYLINEAMRQYARARRYGSYAPRPSAADGAASARQPVAETAEHLSAPPPLPGGAAADADDARPPLYVIFNGHKYLVDKPEFVIGRGERSADLTIKDGNISRRHAVVVFQSGQYFMRDLGSTNGVEYGGQRVDSRRIEEGDAFFLCDYELRFTYY